MSEHTSESASTYLVDFVIPPRNPNDDDDDDEEDEDGDAETEEEEPAVIREPEE
jgi:hypothetical protein